MIIDNFYVDFTNFSTKNVNFVGSLVNENHNFSWETLKNEYNLDNEQCFQRMQLIHAIPLLWKQKINDSKINAETNFFVPSANKKLE